MSSKKIDDIEVLRGFAVLFVILQHTTGNLISWNGFAASLVPYFNGGAGVDLFFAISGFVIAKDFIHRVDARQGYSAKFDEALTFWIKRIWRLIPSAWLWLVIILVLSYFYNRSGIFQPFEANLWATVAGAFNFANFRLADAFGNYSYGASFVYWSLSLEEQFYFLFPLILIFLRPWFIWIVLIVLLAQLFNERTTMMQLMFRTDALMMGILLAMLSNSSFHKRLEPRILKYQLPGMIIVISSFMVLLVAGSNGMKEVLSYRMSIVATVAGFLVYLASYNQSYIMRDSPVKRLFVWTGARSYALYLTHIPAFFLLRESWSRISDDGVPESAYGKLMFVAVAYGLAFALAEANYRFVETPFRRVGQRIAKERSQRAEISP